MDWQKLARQMQTEVILLISCSLENGTLAKYPGKLPDHVINVRMKCTFACLLLAKEKNSGDSSSILKLPAELLHMIHDMLVLNRTRDADYFKVLLISCLLRRTMSSKT